MNPVGPLDFLACAPLLTFLLFKHKHYTILPGQDLQAIFISSFLPSLDHTLPCIRQKGEGGEAWGAQCKFYCSQVKKDS